MYKVGTRFMTDYEPLSFQGSILEVVEVRIGNYNPYLVKVVKHGQGREPVCGKIMDWHDNAEHTYMKIIGKAKKIKTSDFKKGEMVKLSGGSYNGQIAKIIEFMGYDGTYNGKPREKYNLDICGEQSIWFNEDDTILVENIKTNTMKLGIMMKKFLDADTQTLVKAGYINGDLEITEEGTDALMTIIFDANKSALVALATQKLADEEDECCKK